MDPLMMLVDSHKKTLRKNKKGKAIPGDKRKPQAMQSLEGWKHK
jgi:hypothetical protein